MTSQINDVLNDRGQRLVTTFLPSQQGSITSQRRLLATYHRSVECLRSQAHPLLILIFVFSWKISLIFACLSRDFTSNPGNLNTFRKARANFRWQRAGASFMKTQWKTLVPTMIFPTDSKFFESLQSGNGLSCDSSGEHWLRVTDWSHVRRSRNRQLIGSTRLGKELVPYSIASTRHHGTCQQWDNTMDGRMDRQTEGWVDGGSRCGTFEGKWASYFH